MMVHDLGSRLAGAPLTSVGARAMYVGDADVKQARPIADGDDVQRDRCIVARVEVQVHVLARVVAANRRHDRVAGLAAHNKPIVFANARSGSVEVELEKVESELANVWLRPRHGDRTCSRVREGRRSSWIPEVGSIEPDGLAASHLDWFWEVFD